MNNLKDILKRFFLTERIITFLLIIFLLIIFAYSFLKEWSKIDKEMKEKIYYIADPQI